MNEFMAKDDGDAFVRFEQVRKVYQSGEVEIEALRDVNFLVKHGEFCVIVGASGAGKTTILNILGGMDVLTQGHVYFDGKDLATFSKRQLTEYRRYDVGFVFQFYNLIQNLSVEENILLPIKMAGKDVPNYKEKLEEILEITGLTGKRNSKPSQLSGGQQQRVSIARAVLSEPEILLADEPTGNLDSKSTVEIMNLFKKINEEKGITFLQVTHSPETAEYGDRIIRLDSGKLVG